jgi:hypothetical protein
MMAVYAAQHGLQMYELARMSWNGFMENSMAKPVSKAADPVVARFERLLRNPKPFDPNPMVRAASFAVQSLALILADDDFPESEQEK